ncbi:beta-ketoacyl synthase N-terminal-like domain-containing protein, partial [Staphylococcus aureus]|uniref:beta-ketoacyl synthase N-terminal-like domain-containing protein n=1 Tax=Staphylococcus aureus TaxID=1280 RepID=UPI0024C30A5D
MHAFQPKRVVVTGVGVISSLASSARETWQKLVAGETGIRRAANLNPDNHKCVLRADINDEDIPQRFLKGKELRNASRYTRMAMEAAGEAMMDAGLLDDELRPIQDVSAAGVAAGTCIGGTY